MAERMASGMWRGYYPKNSGLFLKGDLLIPIREKQSRGEVVLGRWRVVEVQQELILVELARLAEY
jgi:hypothetical protein